VKGGGEGGKLVLIDLGMQSCSYQLLLQLGTDLVCSESFRGEIRGEEEWWGSDVTGFRLK
jgi:hypothetical protein